MQDNLPVFEPEFEARFRRHEDELKWLYYELYHDDEEAYRYFVSMLYRTWQERPESLKKIDRECEKQPYWYKDRCLTGMLMYTDAFAGTLRGVQKHLDYLEDCGVNYLHLMPLLQSPEGRSDGGYAVSDFRKVEPRLGTMEDLLALSEDCHRRGMKLCLDFVMNHTSEDHEWARAAAEGDPVCQAKYFFYDGWDIPNIYEQTVPQVFPTTAPGNFTWCAKAGKVVMTTFYPYQWDLNYANPMVMNDMTDNMLFLCNHGIDIIRLDAVPYIWKELGTNCRNLPQVHALVRMMRMACEIACPACILLGEVVMEPSRVVPYFGTVDKPECHLLYNVTTMATTWHTVATKDVRLLEHQLRQVFSLPKQYTFLNYLRCHDDIGWGLDYPFLAQFGMQEIPHKRFLNDYFTGRIPGSPARGELYNDDPRLGDARLCGTSASLCGLESALEAEEQERTDLAIRKCVMLHAYMLSLSGIPVLYSGDEIGQRNDRSYHDDPLKREDSRYLHRGSMDWSAAEARNQEGTVENRIFSAIIRLEQIRRAQAVFDADAECNIEETESTRVLGIRRAGRGEEMLAYYNFSDEDETVFCREDGRYTDLIAGKMRDGGVLRLPAGSFIWLLRE